MRTYEYTSRHGSAQEAHFDVIDKKGQLRAVGEYHHRILGTWRKFNVKIHENGRFVVSVGSSRMNIHFYLPTNYKPPAPVVQEKIEKLPRLSEHRTPPKDDWFAESKKPGGKFDMTQIEIHAVANFWISNEIIRSYFAPFDGLRSFSGFDAPAMRYEEQGINGVKTHVMTGPVFVMKIFVNGMPSYVRKRLHVPDGAEPFMNIKPLAPKRDWLKLFLKVALGRR